ncbi:MULTISPECIES: helix-turn-helix transcriptional regulator [unclassified Saccharopolyspora]|uniref:helix-turn-helix domain-containing protein n=1 Tax=unclassified Saccharopolyspora TaxID=2646250 RepID=UPI001CD60B43|nr:MULTISPECIES: helix-turn-helix transcriptional regulator [unclassified Saccharopolyspora]MCA1186904.1 helix-turn-helix domain-containing protein [Saccharopolyspora sp. 6T]MCA1228042.1 helix-turn-helix domain-containing protein [Saccharopolyspora sp. 6M]MCA1281388.1 helix-turn-helix domain-containing protein [Saccharopolyspora sp. 7B]
MATPTVRRLQLGNELRHARQKAGFEQHEAAKELDCAHSKISRLELGQGGITKGDLKLLLEFYGVDPADMQWMFELARTRSTRGRWTGYRAVFPEWFRMYVDLETDAESIRHAQTEIVPGLLQTEGYIRALDTKSIREDEESVDAGTLARQERQAILSKPQPPTLAFILSESCIRRQIGSAAVMRDQLEHLVKIAMQPNVDLQVMPFEAATPVGGISYDFTMLQIPASGISSSLEFVYVECFDDARYLDAKDAVSQYDRLWSHLQAAALGPRESQDLIRSVGKQYS